MALYSFANSQISTALKLLYRARYLTLLICGDNHPDIALLDVSTYTYFNLRMSFSGINNINVILFNK